MQNSFAQNNKIASVYKINRKTEIPLTIGLFGGLVYGFDYLSKKPGVSFEQASTLNPSDVWRFDRPATLQAASQRLKYHNSSDIYLRGSVLMAGLLALDNQIRKDWLDVLILYGETHAINSGIYVLNTSFINRPRPFNYNTEVSIEEKMANETRNSFFSGHVSSAASASFFCCQSSQRLSS